MKKTMLVVLAVALAIPLTFAMAFAGNGLEVNGEHYNLNLLGKVKCPGDDLKNTNRHTIMVLLKYSDPDPNNILGDGDCTGDSTDNINCLVALDRTNKIFLAGGADFQVTDGNACDKDGAALTLPWAIATEWTIWVRELGKPGGTGDIILCGIADMGTVTTDDDEVVCSVNDVDLARYSGKTSPTGTGKSVFRNVTTQLTTIDYLVLVGIDENGDPIYEEESATLFDEDFYSYFWDYDNNGLRLVQLRFYPVVAE